MKHNFKPIKGHPCVLCCTKCGDLSLNGTNYDAIKCTGGRYRHKICEYDRYFGCEKCNQLVGKDQFTYEESFFKRKRVDGIPVNMKFGCPISRNDWIAKQIIE